MVPYDKVGNIYAKVDNITDTDHSGSGDIMPLHAPLTRTGNTGHCDAPGADMTTNGTSNIEGEYLKIMAHK